MVPRTHQRLLPVLAIAAAATMPPGLVLVLFGRQMLMLPMRLHFWVVAFAGAGALAAALAVTVAGARRHDGRAVIVGTAFATMAGLLFVHALATPSVLVGPNGLVQLAGAGNLPAGALVLVLSAIPALRRPRRLGPLLALQAALLALIATTGTVGLLAPSVVPALPGPASHFALCLIAVGVGCYGLLAWRSANTFLLTRRRSDLLVVVGVVWLASACAGLLLFSAMDAGFWISHGFEVAGLALVGGPVAVDLFRRSASRPLVGDLRAVELVAREEAFLGARVRALMVRLAEKDAYTEGHTRRVATLAVQVGEELGLPPARLRALALGGLLHDIGKLSVPDAILQKPGPLDDDEFAAIRRHPVHGVELLGELGGFPDDTRRLVRDHHERLDGKGYPSGLTHDDLDLETRILTVCDVYDALITTRVYRDAWPHERALALLREETGSAFDGRCVRALEAVLAAEADDRAPAPALRPAFAVGS